MKQPQVSVIVPIYNVGRYLRQCLDSIVGQTLRNIEIILIDDGSTDNCPGIVDEYAARDDRIVAIHKPNGGLGAAYNTGVAAATAPYIGFVESDDWIEPDMFQKLYDSLSGAPDADVAKCAFFVYDSFAPKQSQNHIWTLHNGDRKLLDLTTDMPVDVFKIGDLPLLAAVHSSLWSYLYRADFVRGIPFNEIKGAGYPDAAFVFEVLCRARGIKIVPQALHHWRLEQNQGNSTSLKDSRVMQMGRNFLQIKDMLKKLGKWNALKDVFWLHAYIANIGFYNKIMREYKREYRGILRQVFDGFDPANDSAYLSARAAGDIFAIKSSSGRILLARLAGIIRRALTFRFRIRHGFLIQAFGLQVVAGRLCREGHFDYIVRIDINI